MSLFPQDRANKLLMIACQRWDAAMIADKLGVSTRTVYRWIKSVRRDSDRLPGYMAPALHEILQEPGHDPQGVLARPNARPGLSSYPSA